MRALWSADRYPGRFTGLRVAERARDAAQAMGKSLRVDARKYNKNDPGLETKLLTGKCEMYQREKLTVNDPVS